MPFRNSSLNITNNESSDGENKKDVTKVRNSKESLEVESGHLKIVYFIPEVSLYYERSLKSEIHL